MGRERVKAFLPHVISLSPSLFGLVRWEMLLRLISRL